ncbi:MAG: ACP phosphodiesterase [Halioglobus sp.]
MNFLAHFHLAGPNKALIAGGLEGDYYKGLLSGKLSPGIERGIKLHRAIDAHTDNHAVIAELRRHFPPDIRRYAGILIDISFDHYLTRHWAQFSPLALPEFNHRVYRALSLHRQELSPGAQAMASRMLALDILGRYHDWHAVTATAIRIGERFTRGNPLLDVERQLAPVRDRLEQAFLDFYPQLFEFSEKERNKMN